MHWRGLGVKIDPVKGAASQRPLKRCNLWGWGASNLMKMLRSEFATHYDVVHGFPCSFGDFSRAIVAAIETNEEVMRDLKVSPAPLGVEKTKDHRESDRGSALRFGVSIHNHQPTLLHPQRLAYDWAAPAHYQLHAPNFSCVRVLRVNWPPTVNRTRINPQANSERRSVYPPPSCHFTCYVKVGR